MIVTSLFIFSLVELTSCDSLNCPAGYIYSVGSCTPCPLGTYQLESACELITAGCYGNETAQYIPCPYLCPDDYDSSAGSTTCTKIQADQISHYNHRQLDLSVIEIVSSLLPRIGHSTTFEQSSNKVYILGGTTPISFQTYDIVTGAITPLSTSTLQPIYYHSTVLYVPTRTLYVFGGGSDKFISIFASDELWSYNIGTGIWNKLIHATGATWPASREQHGSSIYNHKIYIMGGKEFTTAYTDIWIYNILTNIWTLSSTTLPPAFQGFFLVVRCSEYIAKYNAIYIVTVNPGGQLFKFNPVTDTMTSVTITSGSDLFIGFLFCRIFVDTTYDKLFITSSSTSIVALSINLLTGVLGIGVISGTPIIDDYDHFYDNRTRLLYGFGGQEFNTPSKYFWKTEITPTAAEGSSLVTITAPPQFNSNTNSNSASQLSSSSSNVIIVAAIVPIIIILAVIATLISFYYRYRKPGMSCIQFYFYPGSRSKEDHNGSLLMYGNDGGQGETFMYINTDNDRLSRVKTGPNISDRKDQYVVPMLSWEQLIIPENTQNAVIGQGSFGVVVHTGIRLFESGVLVRKDAAIKVMTYTVNDSKDKYEKVLKSAIDEVQVVMTARKNMTTGEDNIIQIYGIFSGELSQYLCEQLHTPSGTSGIGIAMRYEGGGTLSQWIYRNKGGSCSSSTPEDLTQRSSERMLEKYRILKSIAKGLATLHSLNIVHGDIKPDNVLLSTDDPPIVRLADFGLSSLRNGSDILEQSVDTTMHIRGSPVYCAPEMMINPYAVDVTSYKVAMASRRTDMYAFAILAWELLAESKPYGEQKLNQLQLSMLVHQGTRPPMAQIPPECPIELINMIKLCWHNDRMQRLPALNCYRMINNILDSLIYCVYDAFISYHPDDYKRIKPLIGELERLGVQMKLCHDNMNTIHIAKKKVGSSNEDDEEDDISISQDSSNIYNTTQPLSTSITNGLIHTTGFESKIPKCKFIIACVSKQYQLHDSYIHHLQQAKNNQPEIPILPIYLEPAYDTWLSPVMKYYCQTRAERVKFNYYYDINNNQSNTQSVVNTVDISVYDSGMTVSSDSASLDTLVDDIHSYIKNYNANNVMV